MIISVALLALQIVSPQEISLESLELKSAQLAWNKRDPIRQGVTRLIEQDKLKSASDFRRAADLFAPVGFPQRYFLLFPTSQIWYELNLTALGMGDTNAIENIAKAYDVFHMSLGKGQRFGTRRLPEEEFSGSPFEYFPAHKSIRNVILNPVQALRAATISQDNEELFKLSEADTSDRITEGVTSEQRDRNDLTRIKRVLAILNTDKVRTSRDFLNACLVLQHGKGNGTHFYAHESALCAAILSRNIEKKEGKKLFWNSLALLSMSYDRLLQSSGHFQRFGTQFEGKVSITGINDFQRDIARVPPLAEQPKRGTTD